MRRLLFLAALVLFGCGGNDGTTQYCGDGAVNGSEQCDDGNGVNGDGCSAGCQTEVEPF